MDVNTRKLLTDAARFGRKNPASGRHGIAVTSHPIATRIATEMLRGGGNAADAALAASVAQTVVEPHMTTLCGVLSMLYFDARTGETTYVNGSMARPAGLTSFGLADVTTARSVAVPGFWAAFEAALERHGSRSKAELVAPAIELALDGFEVHPFLYGMAFEHVAALGRYEGGREVFFRDGRLVEVGEVLRQPRLAETLARLVEDGNEHFYRGAFAQRLVETVQAAGGVLTRQDLEDYEARWMEPARGTYRGYDVIGSPPPDRGGTHVIEILNLVEQIPLDRWGPPTQSPDTLYWLARFCGEVYLEGFNQRDPRDYHVPLELITSKEHAARRFELMRMTDPQPTSTPPYPGSNHVTVVDKDGNVASILHSVMSLPWTHGLYVDGVPIWAGGVHFLGNLPKAGGRGSCFVAPTVILKDGKPVLTAGSPSQGLIQNIVQNTLNILDFGLDVEASVHTPRFGGPLSIEGLVGGLGAPTYACEADVDEAVRREVTGRGISFEVVNPWSFATGSYEGVHVVEGVGHACADPRRTGAAEAV
jgi:gamma-glutamyltranspeptidase/glutathione hydrolase